MQLNEILRSMGEQGELIDDTSFETLALAGMYDKVRILTFSDDPKYISAIPENSVVLTLPEFAHLFSGRGVCVCDKPRLLFFNIHNFLSDKEGYKRNQFDTEIGVNCDISPLACIAKNNVKIGDNVVIEEFVSIKENTVIGDNCVIRAGSVIGGEGFEFKRDGNKILSVKHLGGVVMGDNVEVQQLTTVDKAIYPWDNTELGDYCKLDNLIQIGHAAKLKERVLIAAGSVISGRTVLGNDVWVGVGVTVTNGITVGDNARVNLGAIATKNVSDNESVTGNFAIEHSKFIRNFKESLKEK